MAYENFSSRTGGRFHPRPTDDGSSGLGLSIVATIVAAHGWDVHVESGRAGGTKVVFKDVNFAGEE